MDNLRTHHCKDVEPLIRSAGAIPLYLPPYSPDLNSKEQGVASPRGNPKWNKEAISILLSNENYTGRVLLRKTVRIGGSRMKNDGRKVQDLTTNAHEAIIPDEVFREVQEETVRRTNCPPKRTAIQMLF